MRPHSPISGLIFFHYGLFLIPLLLSGIYAYERWDLSERRDEGEPIILDGKLIFISCLDGTLRAVDPLTGIQKWVISEEPVVKVPVVLQSGFTFLPDPQDGSLYLLREGRLKKLPFTIPQLVQAAPCRSSDGILYAGSKKDVWMAIDPQTGTKIETLSQDASDQLCPASTDKVVYIGRTEYTISMFDGRNRERRWNGSFTDYSSHVLPEETDYGLQHFASSACGRILTVDKGSGEVLWDMDFGSPIVAMYILEGDGLHRLPFKILGNDTLKSLIHESKQPWAQQLLFPGERPGRTELYPTLYVGESQHGLYAMPALVDRQTVTVKAIDGPPRLSGPSAGPIQVKEEGKKLNDRPRVVIDPERAKAGDKTSDGEILMIGHHENPETMRSDLSVMRSSKTGPTYFPRISDGSRHFPESHSHHANRHSSKSAFMRAEELWEDHHAGIVSALIGLITGIFVLVYIRRLQRAAEASQHGARSMQTSNVIGGMFVGSSSSGEDIPEGWFQVGKVLFDPKSILGRGAQGTVVYRGSFDGRRVAVKRVVSEFLDLAVQEASLLRESDAHSNVIRYFCMESDSQFRYIALELCWATVHDYVEKEEIRTQCDLSEIQILEQATIGLGHLHSLKIVHRDVKPQNVLLSQKDSRGKIRVVISDFGLCKKLALGRNSVSRASGSITGTDGWIAPEVLCSNTSVTCAVDIFSLGCVFYYVTTKGIHPFGDSLRRQANIASCEYDLKELLKDGSYLFSSLVEKMLSFEPTKRPTTKEILKFPFFWTKSKQLAFFQDVSDRVEKEDVGNPVMQSLERGGRIVVQNDWRTVICPALQADLRKFRTYRGSSVRDLLRAMRNKKHHYRELPEDVQVSLGTIPDNFVTYFTSRFPKLLLHVYEAMRIVQIEGPFHPYYEVEDLLIEEERIKWNSKSDSSLHEEEKGKSDLNPSHFETIRTQDTSLVQSI